MLPKGEWYFNC